MGFWDNLWGSSDSTPTYNDYGSYGGPSQGGGYTPPAVSPTPAPEKSMWDQNLVGGLITAGAGLAGTYYTLQGNKEANEANIAQRQAELAAAAAKGGGGGGGGGGSGLEIARMNNLGALYQNWGALRQKGAENEAAAAQATGKLGQDPIIARLAALR